MRQAGNYQIKIAESVKEFKCIHRLNYKTFVEEIPQHQENEEGSLIDRFHSENTYVIALEDGELVGMIAVRGKRPFSLDNKIPDLDQYLPTSRAICEIRLLAVEKEHRGGPVFFLLMKGLVQYCREMDYNYAVISGTTRQQKLYQHLGFTPFYSAVGKKGAFYIPMQAAMEDFEKNLGELIYKYENRDRL